MNERPTFRARLVRAALLGGLFLLLYPACLYITSLREPVPSFYFEWERHIPFVPWMIFPYLSIDLFFIGAFFLCRTRGELRTLSRRLTVAILVAAACFLLFPLRYAFPTPPTTGFVGQIISAFKGVDRPYNLAPSLHIAIRSIIWVIYIRHSRGVMQVALKTWFILVGLSTLLVYQHHVIDVFTGQLLAMACIFCIPEQDKQPAPSRPRPDLAILYAAGSAACIALAVFLKPYGIVLLYPATTLGCVCFIHATGRAQLFAKANGQNSRTTQILLYPYLLALRISWRIQSRNTRPIARLTQDLLIGRKLHKREEHLLHDNHVATVIDLTAELPGRIGDQNIPLLDLALPTQDSMQQALTLIDESPKPVFLHCALGCGRTALIAAAHLLHTRRAATPEQAIAMVERVNPQAVFPPRATGLLRPFAGQCSTIPVTASQTSTYASAQGGRPARLAEQPLSRRTEGAVSSTYPTI